MARAIWSSIVLALVALHAVPAAAQSARTSSGNAQASQQMQQLAAERTKLVADNEKLKSELAALKKEHDELKKKQDGLGRRGQVNDAAVARAGAKADALQKDLDGEKARMAELIAKFRETAGTLRDVETDRTQLKTSLAKRDAELGVCVDRNRSLYTLNGEILNKLETRGAGFSPLEPFTRLKRVELENLIDGYQTRADEQRPPTAATAAPAH